MKKISSKKLKSIAIVTMLTFSMVPIGEDGNTLLSLLFDIDPLVINVSAAWVTISDYCELRWSGSGGPTSSSNPCKNGVGMRFQGLYSGTTFSIRAYYSSGSTMSGFTSCWDTSPGGGSWSCDGGGYDWDPIPSQSLRSAVVAVDGPSGTSDSTTVWWSNVDPNANEAPIIADPTVGLTQEYATSGTFGITWSATDADSNLDIIAVDDVDGGYDYTSGGADFYDDVGIDGGSDSLITTFNKNAWLGEKTYRGQVTDDGVGALTDTTGDIVITIQDTTNPVRTAQPTNDTVTPEAYEEGDGDWSQLSWTYTDVLADDYILQRRCYSQTDWATQTPTWTVTSASGLWTSGNAITFTPTPSYSSLCNSDGAGGSQSSYNLMEYYLRTWDTSNNMAATTFRFVKVYESLNPILNAPADIHFEDGSSRSIAWTWTDNADSNSIAEADWSVKENVVSGSACSGTTVATGTWSGAGGSHTSNGVPDDPDQETADIYWCLTATDDVNNIDTDIVWINYTSSLAPEINSPIDQNYEYGNEQTINWVWSDNFNHNQAGTTGSWRTAYSASAITTVAECNSATQIATSTWDLSWNNVRNEGWTPSMGYNGVYLCIVATDEAGNSQFNTVFMDILPSQNPAITGGSSGNQDFGGWEVGGQQGTLGTSMWYTDNFDLAFWQLRVINGSTFSNCATYDFVHRSGSISGTSANSIPIGATYPGTDGFSPDTYYLFLYVEDAVGNSACGWANNPNTANWFEVFASAAPVITSAPADIFYEEGNTLVRYLEFTATEDMEYQYNVYVSQTFGSWGSKITPYNRVYVSGVPETVTTDVGGYAAGIWYWRITVEESPLTVRANGLLTEIFVTVTVSTAEAPQITQNAYDQDYEASNIISRIMTWEATDSYPGIYFIERQLNGGGWTTLINTTWSSGVPVTQEVGSLGAGNWVFKITFRDSISDAGGLETIHSINVKVYPQASPVFMFTPTDVDYEDGNTDSRTVQWTAIDAYPYQYQIDRQIDGGGWNNVLGLTAWTNQTVISAIQVGSLAEGTWEYRARFYENINNATNQFADEIVIIKVYPNANPVITVSPSTPIIYEDGNTASRLISWTARDSYPYQYNVETRVYSAGWSGWTPIATGITWTNLTATTTYNMGNVQEGYYEYRINFFDDPSKTAANNQTHTVVVDVKVSEAPQLTLTPTFETYEEGNVLTKIKTWRATDYFPNNYEIDRSKNGGGWVVQTTGSWTNNSDMSWDVGSLTVGSYDFRVVAWEEGNSGYASSKFVIDTITITVLAPIAPIISSNTFLYPIGDTSSYKINFVWTDNDDNDAGTGTYSLVRSTDNSTWGGILSSGTWAAFGSFLDYEVGNEVIDYYYRLTVVDQAGNIGQHYNVVYVTPQVDTYKFNIEGHDTDLEAYLPLDGDLLDYSLSGSDGTFAGVTYTTGQYGQAAVFDGDGSGGGGIDLGNVFENLTRFSISTWVYLGTDPYTNVYNYIFSNARDCCGVYNGFELLILRNNSLRLNFWNGESSARVFSWAYSFSPNSWYYIGASYDDGKSVLYIGESGVLLNNSNSDPLNIIGTPASFNSYVGRMGAWNNGDLDGRLDDFRLYSGVKNGYLFKELFTNSPFTSLSSTDEKSSLIFTAFDNPQNGNWELYRNGSQLVSSSWDSQPQYYDITENGTLLDGLYNWTLVVWDDKPDATILNYVVPYSTIAPEIYIPLENGTYTPREKLRWGVLENHPKKYRLYRNGTNILNGTYSEGLYTDIALNDFAVGFYNVTIEFIDNANRSSVAMMWLNLVLDKTAPLILENPLDKRWSHSTVSQTVNNSNLDYYIYDESGGYYEIFRCSTSTSSDCNGVSVKTGTFDSGYVQISRDVAPDYTVNVVGERFNFTIVFTDLFGNEAQDSIFAFFDTGDTSDPTLPIAPLDINMVAGTSGNIIRWGWLDEFPNRYRISVDGVTVITNGIWSNGDWIYYDVNYLEPGFHSILITVYDARYQSFGDSVDVVVTAS